MSGHEEEAEVAEVSGHEEGAEVSVHEEVCGHEEAVDGAAKAQTTVE